MKIRFYLLLVCFLMMNCRYIQSQEDSLYRAISSYNDTTAQFIIKARNLMMLKLNAKDYRTVSNIKKLLDKSEGNDYVALYAFERWMLGFILNDYNNIFETVISFDSSYYDSFKYRIKPPNDVLEYKLANFVCDNKGKILNDISDSNINEEDKEFLKLKLNYICLIERKPENYNDSINNSAIIFLERYPNTKFKEFIKKHMQYQFGPSDIGLGFNVGFGIRMNSGKIRNTIDEGILIGIGTVVNYKMWDYNFSLFAGPCMFYKDIPVNNNKILPEGLNANYVKYEFSVDRNILNLKKHKLSPSIGIGFTEFTPLEDSIKYNSYYKDLKTGITNILLGFNYQFRYPIRSINPYIYNSGLINFRYEISLQPNDGNLFKGMIHYLTLTWGLETRGWKKY